MSYQKGRFIPPKPGFWEQPRLIRPRLYASDLRRRERQAVPRAALRLLVIVMITIIRRRRRSSSRICI